MSYILFMPISASDIELISSPDRVTPVSSQQHGMLIHRANGPPPPPLLHSWCILSWNSRNLSKQSICLKYQWPLNTIVRIWLRKGERGNFHLALLLQRNDVTTTTLTPPGCPPIEGLLTPPHGVWGFPGSLPEEHSWPLRAWPPRWPIWPHSDQLGCKSGTSYLLESPCLFVRLRVQRDFSSPGILVSISLICSRLTTGNDFQFLDSRLETQ